MSRPEVLPSINGLAPYVPGLSIEEIRAKYGLDQVIKLASNENPLGISPLAREAIRLHASDAFRYPQGGNPVLRKAVAALHGLATEKIVLGNGSDEIIDLLIRMLAMPGRDNLVCFEPCFSIYPLQGRINNIQTRRVKLNKNFSFDFTKLLEATDENTALVFITMPDNPSGYCPNADDVRDFSLKLAYKAPRALLVVDEAYIDFADSPNNASLLDQGWLPENIAYLRTFSKSWGLAGLRLGYGVVPERIADGFWRARLPFSVNILVEQAALAAIDDDLFRGKTLETVRSGRAWLSAELGKLGCQVWPSQTNFLMFQLPENAPAHAEFMDRLLRQGVIIRSLASYNLPDHYRVSIGTQRENALFIAALTRILEGDA